MSDTPRTDAVLKSQWPVLMEDFARDLERELIKVSRELERARTIRITLICPFCGRKNEQAVDFCECGAMPDEMAKGTK